jgi:hypothetical protein
VSLFTITVHTPQISNNAGIAEYQGDTIKLLLLNDALPKNCVLFHYFTALYPNILNLCSEIPCIDKNISSVIGEIQTDIHSARDLIGPLNTALLELPYIFTRINI